MASNNQSTTFGATIVPQEQRPLEDDLTLPQRVLDTPNLTPAASREDLTPSVSERRIPPHSPFYTHQPDSLDRVHTRTSSKANVAVNEKDLEAGVRTPLAADAEQPFTGKVSVDCNKECTMWPSKQTLMQSRKSEKKKRRDQRMLGCGPVRDFWAKFTKRQRLYIKIAMALFFIAVIVAIAVGITVAVNGTVYVSDGHQEQIPEPGDGN